MFGSVHEGRRYTVASESALRSAWTLLSRFRALPPAPWPEGGPKSLRSPCCRLAIYKNQFGHETTKALYALRNCCSSPRARGAETGHN
ncbi:hypothetical protein PoB_007500200 [Plakobranchus ocellatus]|uniref:Uncharacterized protein n=1 Tax=Plakobranchus ocellatus TaxID=259542 RepID=A0AAV4DW20_9GAST|nr:hypothetical protein PoB_007500200 [Plakobranchus ocellatus]